jgi:hypothetical protein
VLVWRDATRWLLHAGGLIALAVAIAVNLIDPSALVARQNLERVVDPSGLPADASRALDAEYLATLGDGALPTVVEYLPRLSGADRETLAFALRLFVLQGRDLSPAVGPGFSLDRERARQALIALGDELRTYPPIRGGHVGLR